MIPALEKAVIAVATTNAGKLRDAAKAVLNLKSENGQLRYSLYAGYGANDFVSGSNNKVYSRLFQQFYDFNAFKTRRHFHEHER